MLCGVGAHQMTAASPGRTLMLRVTKHKAAGLAGVLAAVVGISVVSAGPAVAWKIELSVEGSCDTLKATGFYETQFETNTVWGGPLDSEGNEVDTVNFTIQTGTGPVVVPVHFPNLGDDTMTDAERGTGTGAIQSSIAAGEYTVTWDVYFSTGHEPGDDKIEIPSGCDTPPPGSAAPGVSAEVDCENEGIKVTLDNTEGSAEADFTVTVGDEVKMQAVAAGETADVSFGPLDDGDYEVVVSESTTRFSDSLPVTVECDETPPPTEPTPTPTVQGSTLPHTGAGFPTGAAAAFALLLVSVGGFLLTYRKGLLPLPFMHRH